MSWHSYPFKQGWISKINEFFTFDLYFIFPSYLIFLLLFSKNNKIARVYVTDGQKMEKLITIISKLFFEKMLFKATHAFSYLDIPTNIISV